MSANEHQIPYEEVHDGPSIVFCRGTVVLSEGFSLLNEEDLNNEMRLVVDLAVSIYNSWLVSKIIFFDEQPRLLLTFRVNILEKTMSLRLNLEKLSTEIANGFSTELLKQSLNILK